jgi:hypothetical protein
MATIALGVTMSASICAINVLRRGLMVVKCRLKNDQQQEKQDCQYD